MSNFRGGFNGGGFGGGMNMQSLMRQAQQMQQQMESAKKDIEESEFTSKVGGGMVEVVALGTKQIKSIKIKPEIVDPDDVEMLEDLITAGVNDVLMQIDKMEKEKLPQMPAGM